MTQTVPGAPATPPRVPDDSTFGARLALVRQLMHWGNIAEAARECGVPVDSWRNWEVDGREPRRLVTIAMAIATRANVDIDWLVYGRAKRRSELTGGYPRDLADLVNPPIPAALAPRIVRHGDGRRIPRQLRGGAPIPQQSRIRRPDVHNGRPVSRSPVT